MSYGRMRYTILQGNCSQNNDFYFQIEDYANSENFRADFLKLDTQSSQNN